MNKFMFSLALATGLTAGLAAPSVRADAIQTLPTTAMQSSQFDQLFQPDSSVLSSPFQFNGVSAPVSGTMQSQVFQGTGAATGLYAYAYQFDVNNVKDSDGQSIALSGAQWKFAATPVGSDLTNTGHQNFAYVISDGPVGGLNTPQGAQGQPILAPTQLNWLPNTTVGSLITTYFSPSQTAGLLAGANSATFIVLSSQPPDTSKFSQASILSSDPSTSPSTYTPTPGTIEPVPVPEPSTVLAWAGMAGAVAVVRRVRKNRLALA